MLLKVYIQLTDRNKVYLAKRKYTVTPINPNAYNVRSPGDKQQLLQGIEVIIKVPYIILNI